MVATCLSTSAFASGALELREIGDEEYTEQLVAIADLSDGSYVKVRLGVSNVGPGDGKSACELLVVRRDGTVASDQAVVDRDERSYDPKAQKLRIGACSAEAGDALTLEAVLPKGRVRIVLSAAPKRARAHSFESNGDFYELDTLVLWAPAQVTLSLGGKTETLAGYGYADHPRSKIMPKPLARHWVRFRAMNQADPRVVLIRFPQKGAPLGFHDSKTNGRESIVRAKVWSGGRAKPSRVRLKSNRTEWRITTSKLLHRSAPIEAQGALGSVLKSIVGNPVTYTFRGALLEKGTSRPVPGIVEITVTDE